MALNQVTVNIDNTVLPNGRIYQATQSAVLSDEQFARLDPTAFLGGSPLLTLVKEGFYS